MANRNKKGQFKKGGGGGGATRAKKSKGKKGGHSRTLEGRVKKLEHNLKIVVAVVKSHDHALVKGGLIAARGRRALPAVGGA